MKDWSTLAKIVTRRTYSRNDNGSLETWKDIVDRCIAGNVRDYSISEPEISRLKHFMYHRKAMPAGRGLWFSGSPSHKKLGGVALCNCWQLSCDNWTNFVVGQDLLMLGGGVGMSVEHRFVSKIPRVKKNVRIIHKLVKDADFIVPDSREGWNELTYRVLESFFVTGRSFSYSTICVRDYGQAIKGFGGTASGAKPLIECISKLSGILSAREGKSIRPLDAADVLCAIGEMVVMGNVRRSAILILGDPWDKDYLKAKRWDIAPIPSYRAMANYSVVCDDIDDLHPLYWKTYESGEAFGLFNRTTAQTYGRMGELKPDSATGTNPCQPGFATVLAPTGIKIFDDVNVGSVIWSGGQWTVVRNKICTGTKPVFKFSTNAGIFVGTKEHRICQRGEKVKVESADSIDISYNSNVIDVDVAGLNDQDVMDGWVLGDGAVHKASNNLVYLCIGENDSCIFKTLPHLILRDRRAAFKHGWEITTTISWSELPHTYMRCVPTRFKHGSFSKMRGFLRGLYAANGSVVGQRITLKAASLKIIEDVQQMLSALGIPSYYTTNCAHDVVFSNGEYECKQSFDLNITHGRALFNELIGFVHESKQHRLESLLDIETNRIKLSFDINKVEYLGDFPVYDLTVDAEEHTYWTGGVLASNCGEAMLESFEQCNLQELFLPNLHDVNEFREAAVLMHRWGKRVTCELYHHPQSDEVVKRNRRVGTGITGCLQNPSLFDADVLDHVYQAVQAENVLYSKELQINESIRTTLIKPSGTLSFVGECTPGIHPAFSRHYIRRIRFGSNDPLISVLKAAKYNIYPVQRFDGSLDHSTLIVDFYGRAPDGTPCADEGFDTWHQLDTLLFSQRHWSDQSVSVTVYYTREEIGKIKEWLSINLKNIKTISFLCKNDHGFLQAPLEAITQSNYEELCSSVRDVDIDLVSNGHLDSLECDGGVCPIK